MKEGLVELLEGIAATKNLAQRAQLLRKVTDLFVVGSASFSEDQVETFDGVLSELIENIELAARVACANRLARIPNAPGMVMRALAFDDAIEVAAPVLAYSARLDEAVLAENARTKSQDH